MLNLKDIDETKFIMQAMSDARKPIDHIWLGGRIINGAWMWVGRDVENPLENIPTRLDETGFPPWCDNETNFEMSCLNLDRQNHWTPLIYGLECNSTEAVVCVQRKYNKNRYQQTFFQLFLFYNSCRAKR